jgi:NADH-quinone oxidoreductase subunit G
MSKQVNLTINDREVSVPEGTNLVDAAKLAGIDIPVFCYHPKMEPAGMCRMCLVEIGRPMRDKETGDLVLDDQGNPKINFSGNLETACTLTASEGMVVKGMTDKVQDGRRDVLEFLLTSHPLDCPTCDKGGECALQDLTMAYGPGESRFPLVEKIQLGKHLPLGDLIYLDQERCIQCGRCIRFQENLVDDPVLEFYHRGRHTEIVSYSEPPFDSYWSGNTTDICPVGALTTADFRFEARIWEMDQKESVCSHCPVGCNLTVDIRRQPETGQITIQRIMPRQHEAVNEVWICDKGRFAHQFSSHPDRLHTPLIRDQDGELVPVSWEEALERVKTGLKWKENQILTLVGSRLSNEDLFQLRHLNDGLGGQAALLSEMAGGDLVSQVGLGPGSNLAELGAGDAVLIAACDLEEEAPIWWMRIKAAAERGAELIVANPRPTKTDRYADHILRYVYGEEIQTVEEFAAGASEAARAFAEADQAVVFYGSEGVGYQTSRALAQACANLLIETDHVGRPNNGLVAVWPGANTQGAWDMGFRPLAEHPAALEEAGGLYIAGADPVGDGWAEDLGDKFLVVQEIFLTETAQQADVVLPARAQTETSGTYTSGERRVQRFESVVPHQGAGLPDFEIVSRVGALLGLDMPNGSAEAVLDKIARQKPDYAEVSLQSLRQVEPQFPIIVPREYAYIGTAYKNTFGLGVQLAPFAQRAQVTAADLPAVRSYPEADLLAVPVTRLYDQGTLLAVSENMAPRLLEDHFILNPAEASRVKTADGARVTAVLGDREFTGQVAVDESVPDGVVLIPRSMGIPVHEPSPVEFRVTDVESGGDHEN